MKDVFDFGKSVTAVAGMACLALVLGKVSEDENSISFNLKKYGSVSLNHKYGTGFNEDDDCEEDNSAEEEDTEGDS